MRSASALHTTAAVLSEPTLADVLRDLWRARTYLMAGAASGLLCAALFLFLAVPQYGAAMLVSPTTRSGTPDISALFPNNASFAMEYVMQSFGPGDSSDFMRFEAILREASVAAQALKDEKIRAGIADARQWRFETASGLSDAAALAAWLQKNITVEPVGQTRLKRIGVRHPDPVFAAYLLQKLYDTADGIIRAELEDKTQKRIAYLEHEIDSVSHPDHKRVLTKLLMDQEQIRMILSVNEPFAALMAEPPAAGPKPVWPRRSLVLPGFAFAGMFAGYVLFILRRRAAP